MQPFYNEDLAYVHHIGFGDFSRKAGSALLKIFQSSQISSGLVIDLGCGSGIWSKKLTDSGYRTMGIDFSKSMIELARKTAPKAQFQTSSIHEAELQKCSAVTALGEGFNYIVGDVSPLSKLEKILEKIAEHLIHGGVLAFDVIVQDEQDSLQQRSWRKGDDWAVLVETTEQKTQNELTREITIFREINGCYRRSFEKHRIHVFDSAKIVRLLEKNNFDVTVSRNYGEFELAPRRLAFIATKQGAEK